MTFVSSFRPHSGNNEYSVNQTRAIQSWESYAENIILFGDHEPSLAFPSVTFVKSNGQWPTIKELIRIAAISEGTTCIINADIVLGENFRDAVDAWNGRHGLTAISQRYEYDPARYPHSLSTAKVNDVGFDFFMARQSIWQEAAKEVPDEMWIGHCLWDNWMLGFFAVHGKQWHFDLTSFRFMFHPRHGNRKQPLRVNIDSHYIQHHGWGRRL